MQPGDEVFIKARVTGSDSNPHGSSIQVEIPMYIDNDTMAKLPELMRSYGDKPVKVWIHRIDIPTTVFGPIKKADPKTIEACDNTQCMPCAEITPGCTHAVTEVRIAGKAFVGRSRCEHRKTLEK